MRIFYERLQLTSSSTLSGVYNRQEMNFFNLFIFALFCPSSNQVTSPQCIPKEYQISRESSTRWGRCVMYIFELMIYSFLCLTNLNEHHNSKRTDSGTQEKSNEKLDSNLFANHKYIKEIIFKYSQLYLHAKPERALKYLTLSVCVFYEDKMISDMNFSNLRKVIVAHFLMFQILIAN